MVYDATIAAADFKKACEIHWLTNKRTACNCFARHGCLPGRQQPCFLDTFSGMLATAW